MIVSPHQNQEELRPLSHDGFQRDAVRRAPSPRNRSASRRAARNLWVSPALDLWPPEFTLTYSVDHERFAFRRGPWMRRVFREQGNVRKHRLTCLLNSAGPPRLRGRQQYGLVWREAMKQNSVTSPSWPRESEQIKGGTGRLATSVNVFVWRTDARKAAWGTHASSTRDRQKIRVLEER